MLFEHIFYLARASIHSDKLVVDMMVHNPLLQFELVKCIVSCLDIAKLCTSSKYCDISYLVRLDRFCMHHVPVLDCSWSEHLC